MTGQSFCANACCICTNRKCIMKCMYHAYICTHIIAFLYSIYIYTYIHTSIYTQHIYYTHLHYTHARARAYIHTRNRRLPRDCHIVKTQASVDTKKFHHPSENSIYEVVRHSQPYYTLAEQGLYYITYGSSCHKFDAILDVMTGMWGSMDTGNGWMGGWIDAYPCV